MKVWSLIKDGKEGGQTLIEFENVNEVKNFCKVLEEHERAYPKLRRSRIWLKMLRKNLPFGS